MKEFLIQNFFNYEFVYIFLRLAVVFLILVAFVKRNFLKIFVSIFFILGISELILSLYISSPIMEENTTYLKKIVPCRMFTKKDKMVYDKATSKKICNENIKSVKNINDKSRYVISFDVSQTLYNNDFRYTQCNNDSEQSYIFLGCSFVFGAGLNDDQTLPYYFSKLMNFKNNVINAGVPGKGTNATLNILNNASFMPLMKHNSKIIHCFYLLMDDHLWRNFRIESTCLDNYLVTVDNKMRVKQPLGMIKILFARSYLFRKIVLPIIDKYNKPFYENHLINNLEKIENIIQNKYNSKLTIIIWPKLHKGLVDKLKNMSLDIILLPEYFSSDSLGYKIPYDGHPSAKANEKIANIILAHKM